MSWSCVITWACITKYENVSSHVSIYCLFSQIFSDLHVKKCHKLVKRYIQKSQEGFVPYGGNHKGVVYYIYIYIYKVSYKITQCEIGECIKCIRHIDKLSYNMWIIHNYETHMLWKNRCIPWMRLLVKKKHFSCLTIA